jgi:hypothetical protein
MLKQFDIDLAGDFLVMAATLMEIKSAMLLPKAAPEEMAEDEAGDPRAELIRQLLEYKKFKDAANLLDAAAEQHQERFGRPTSLIDQLAPNAEPEVDMDQVSIWDLLEAFDTVCKAIGNTATRATSRTTPIDCTRSRSCTASRPSPMTFERVFDSRRIARHGRAVSGDARTDSRQAHLAEQSEPPQPDLSAGADRRAPNRPCRGYSLRRGRTGRDAEAGPTRRC